MDLITVILTAAITCSNVSTETTIPTDSISTCEVATISDTSPIFTGFSRLGGFPSAAKVLDDSTTGYAYYNVQIYKTSFTDKSNLFLAHVTGEFTPGVQAYWNGHTNYNQAYALWNGYIHCRAEKQPDATLSGTTPSVYYKTSWPDSSAFSTVYSSSVSSNYSFNSTITGGVEWESGPSIEGQTGSGISITYGTSLATSYDDPYVSKQYSTDNNSEIEWWYNATSSPANIATFKLETFYLFEMNTVTDSFRNNSFVLYVDIGMTNINTQTAKYTQQKQTIKIDCFCDYC